MTPEDIVDLTELKSVAQKCLRHDSVLKSLIMAEPDVLPRREAIAKIPIFSRLLERELGYESPRTHYG